MNVRNIVLLIACLILAVGLGLLLGKSFEAQKQILSIKTYTVPVARAEEIRRSLNQLFSGDHADGSSQIFGNDALVVKASEPYQQGVAQLIEKLSKEKLTARSVHFDYWMVRSEPTTVANSPGLAPLQTILATISQAQGAKNFTLLEHLAFNTLSGREVRIKGAMAEIKAKPVIRVEGLDSDVKINSIASLGEIETSVNLKSGDFVVMGQTVLQPNARALADDKAATLPTKDVFHILRAEILP